MTVYSLGAEAFVYVNAGIYCRELEHFKHPDIESLWIVLRPKRLPRSILIILVAVIYHSTFSSADANSEFYNHIQSNIDSFLSHHPDALNQLVLYLMKSILKRLTGLTQIINLPTRSNSILDWCLVNTKKVCFAVTQLPPLGSSDHNCILIKSHVNHSEKPSIKRVYKRDLRESRIRHFGQTITTFDWSEICGLTDVNEKYNSFNEIVSAMIECYFPNKSTNVRFSDKPWITQSLKSSISKRQKLFHKYGKDSETYISTGVINFKEMLNWLVENIIGTQLKS